MGCDNGPRAQDETRMVLWDVNFARLLVASELADRQPEEFRGIVEPCVRGPGEGDVDFRKEPTSRGPIMRSVPGI